MCKQEQRRTMSSWESFVEAARGTSIVFSDPKTEISPIGCYLGEVEQSNSPFILNPFSSSDLEKRRKTITLGVSGKGRRTPRKRIVRNIIEVSSVPYEEGMLDHFLEVRLQVEDCGRLETQLWCFGKDEWQDIKKKGYFLA